MSSGTPSPADERAGDDLLGGGAGRQARGGGGPRPHEPGAMVFARMPSGPPSTASCLVIDSTAPFPRAVRDHAEAPARPAGVDGGEVDDRRAPRRLEQRPGFAAGEEHQVDLSRDGGPPLRVEVHLVGPRHVRGDRGGVDEDVRTAVPLAGHVDVPPHVVRPGEVQRVHRLDRGARLRGDGRGLLRAIGIDVAADDRRALGREPEGDALADPRADARHQRHLVLEPVSHAQILSLRGRLPDRSRRAPPGWSRAGVPAGLPSGPSAR